MSRLDLRQIRVLVCLGSAAVLLASGLASSARAETELRWKFKKGEKSRYEIKMDITQETKAQNMPFQVKISQVMDMTWDVQDVADDGVATLNQTIDRVRMEMTLPQAGQPPLKYDSQQTEKAPGTEMFSKIFDAMVGKPFVVKVSPVGKVVDLKAPEGALQAFKNLPAGQGGMFSEEGLKQMIGQSMLSLPAEAVAPGKSWESTTEMQAPPLGKQISTMRYTFAGEEDFNGKKVDKIDIAMDVKLESAPDAQAKIELKDSQASGAIYWDNQAGQPVESRVNSKMTFAITVNGMTIDQAVTTNNVMKRVSDTAAREL